MAHNPVGINSALPITTSSARGVDTTAHKTDALRVVAVGAGAHVAIGTLPTATTQNYYVAVGEEEVINLGACRNQKVIGITTGGTTTIDFPEGTGSPFQVGDAVSLTVTGQTRLLDFTHKIVSSINNTAGISGFYSTRIVVNHDSSSGNPAALNFNQFCRIKRFLYGCRIGNWIWNTSLSTNTIK